MRCRGRSCCGNRGGSLECEGFFVIAKICRRSSLGRARPR